VTCADLIRGNTLLQEAFAQLQVTPVLCNLDPEQDTKSRRMTEVYVIDGLLDLTLSVPSLQAFNARVAACECIKAYFYNHSIIRLHFLRRAIGGHASGTDETANIFTVLLGPTDQKYSGDPYRCWFAAVLLFHLIFEDEEAKNLAMNVAEGDASNGEEVVTCIQSLVANLITAMQKGEDDRVLTGFLMLLCGWLFEDPDAVDDFLGEGSSVQSLVHVLQGDHEGIIVQGLCAVLLGVVYEFSTKDSPLPRMTLHSILTSRMGRDQYIDRLTKLRRHPLLRDFEVLPQKMSTVSQGGLPEIYFDKTFVDFIKDNFSRLLRSIDRDPAVEILVDGTGIRKGISREMVDSLRLQLEEKSNALQTAQSDLLSLERQLGQERVDHRKDKETTTLEISRMKNVNDSLQHHHQDESR
jgi:intracellular protein transport protein USO1